MSPAPFVLLADVLPGLVRQLAQDLQKGGHRRLADQIPELRIYGRCSCGSRPCRTFYCLPPNEFAKLARSAKDIDGVSIAKGRIVRVETLSAEVDSVLDQIF